MYNTTFAYAINDLTLFNGFVHPIVAVVDYAGTIVSAGRIRVVYVAVLVGTFPFD
jgi:hypothetical protein